MDVNNQLLIFNYNRDSFPYGEVISENFGIAVLQFNTIEEKEDAIKIANEKGITYFENEIVKAQEVESEEEEIKREGPLAGFFVKEWTGTNDICKKDIIIAVLDTGFTLYNEKYRDRIISSNYNFTSSDTIEDLNEHGTQIASIILESTCDNIKILPIKILEDNGAQGTLFSLYQGIMAAVNENVNIINISASSKTNNSALIDAAIAKAQEKGIKIVAAAGNGGEDAANYSPANNPYVITVGALEDDFDITNFSNTGDCVNYYSLGVEIPTKNTFNEDTTLMGTSASAAIVTSIIATVDGADENYDLDKFLAIESRDDIKILNFFKFYRKDLDDVLWPIKSYNEDVVYKDATSYVTESAGRKYVAYNWADSSGNARWLYFVTGTAGSNSAPASLNSDDYGIMNYWVAPATLNFYSSPDSASNNSQIMINRKVWCRGCYYSSGSGTKSSPYIYDKSSPTYGFRAGGKSNDGYTPGTDVTDRGGWGNSGQIKNLHGLYFNSNGGSGAPSNIYRLTSSRVLIPATRPTHSSMFFGGWSKAKGGARYALSGGYFPPSDPGYSADHVDNVSVTLYAIWMYQVLFDFQGGTADANANNIKYFYSYPGDANGNNGNFVTAQNSTTTTWGDNKPTRTGFTFQGYYTEKFGQGTQWYNANGVHTSACSHKNVKSTFTLYASWKANTIYTITLNKQSGTGGLDKFYSVPGSYFTLDSTGGSNASPYGFDNLSSSQIPTRAGYTFGGYYTAANGGGKEMFNASGTRNNTNCSRDTITANTTLYAKWTANTYTITFAGNGATSGVPSAINRTYGQSFTFPSSLPVKAGYTFNGWKHGGNVTDSTLTTTETKGTYMNGATVSPSSGNICYTASNSTYVATWVPATYKIYFAGNGATSGVPSAIDRTYGESVTFPSDLPVKTGYTFLGWKHYGNGSDTTVTSTDTSGTKYLNGQTVAPASGNICYATSDKVYIAIWEANTYTITFAGNGATSGVPAAITRTYGQSVTFPSGVPTKSGYVFNGWLHHGDGSDSSATTTTTKGTYMNGETVEPASGNICYSVKDKTYVATWLQVVSVPTWKGTLTYNGSSQSATTTTLWNNYSTTSLTIGGTTSGTNATSYNATFTPKSGYCWSDGTATAKTVSWSIAQKEVGLTWGDLAWNYDGNTHSTTCTATGVISGDTCTVTLSGNSVGPDLGTATVTATGLSNTNYKLPSSGTSKTLTISGGLVHIFNGSTWLSALPYVYINGSWRQALPYIFRNGDWTIGV